MEAVETTVRKKPWEVDRRLAELSLSRNGLLAVRDMALAAASDATPFHPTCAPGMFAYLQGVFALRDQFIGKDWMMDRSGAVEMIRNDQLRIKVGFANVDLACNDEHDPRARSRKGAAAERACQGNLFPDLPKFAPKQRDVWATFYLMVSADGAAELSRPVVQGDNFGPFVERIYLSDGFDFDGAGLTLDEGDVADDFDPIVARK